MAGNPWWASALLSGPAQSSSDFISDLVTSLFLEPGFLPVSSVMPETEGAWEYRFVGIKQHFTECSRELRC